MNKTYTIILLILCLYLGTKAQDVVPLKIGDKIPDSVWNTEFSTITGDGEVRNITLSRFKGKALIIDFWATWCTSCIQGMPKLKSLQNKFQKDLIILSHTAESQEKVLKFLKTNQIGKENLQLSIINDVSIAKLFPHRVLPHYVWINPQGIVAATSSSEDVTEKNINEMINGKKTAITIKEDIDPSLPLFLRGDVGTLKIVHNSILTKGFYNGLVSGNQYRREAGILNGRAMTNTELGTIYTIIAKELFKEQGLKLNKDQIKNNLKNPKELDEIYTYELTIPVSKAGMLYKYMLEDLNRYLPYEAKIETQAGSLIFTIRNKVK